MAWHFPSTGAYWDFLIELTALGPLIRSLPDKAREAFRATLAERLRPSLVSMV